MDELKPCPFCGDDGDKGAMQMFAPQTGAHWTKVTCRGCGASVSEQAWNIRPVTVSEGEAEQCRLNAMGAEREAKLMAELERLKRRQCKCEFSSGGVLKKSCEYHNQREKVAERNALERAAKVCDEADKSTHPAELADAIRARGLE